ncbi:MAG TPA: VOC family protein [Bryobacteraceae bacterium]|jgi:uncharacterized glyoxalase superfamily protein PhnB/catechol 2,3-dioxygenase-like lactoylglutathione lyase family enzyme|nr:VOC family protein [Bryobacteraceae bacterium]
MIANRSVPPDTVLPHVVYKDVLQAIAWLAEAFGFTEQYRYGDPGDISGAQVRLERAWIMLNKARPGSLSPAQLGGSTQSLTIFVDDVDAHFQRAKSAGAKIVEDLHETVYGERQYGAEDLDGHHWLFSRHARDVHPEEWGAAVSQITSFVPHLLRPSFCYLQIPALTLDQSIHFYEKTFGWNIRGRGSSHPSFDDAAGNLSGSWFTGREISSEPPSLLPSIWVDSLTATLSKVTANGGVVIEDPHPDSPGGTSWIATFRDPAGNVLRLYQEGVGENPAGAVPERV